MSEVTPKAGAGPRDRMAAAVILIMVGVVGLAAQLLDVTADMGGWVVIIIGAAFLVAFAFTRQYGYLVPGGIMTGVGAGIIASQNITLADEQGTGGIIALGLGLGFLSIWVIGAIARVDRHHWWPVIPGAILTVVGAVLLIGGQAVNLLDYWGVAIVAVGLFVLWRAWGESRART